MGFFKKIFNKFTNKNDDTVEKISQKNEENRIFKVSDNQKKFDEGLRKSSSTLNDAIVELFTKLITSSRVSLCFIFSPVSCYFKYYKNMLLPNPLHA